MTTEDATPDAPVEQRVDALFVGLGRLTDTDLLLLRSYWDEVDPEARKSAWQQASNAIKRANRQTLIDSARDRIAYWVNDYESAYWQGPIGGGDGFPAASVRTAAIPPLMDAVVAAATSDMLDAEVTTVLDGPLTRLYDEMRTPMNDPQNESTE